jgi:hypothetical protein
MENPTDPAADLHFIRRMMERTHARVDPHAFHFVLWGSIVLVFYPLLNWFELRGRPDLRTSVGLGALGLGVALSFLLELRLKARSRLEGENTFVSRQIVRIVAYHIGVASLLSAVGPMSGFVPGPFVSHLWGFTYASMAFMIGVVYTREYLAAGIAILAGSLLALALPGHAGFILGPFMGLGLMIPGLIAERRVARLRTEREAPL